MLNEKTQTIKSYYKELLTIALLILSFVVEIPVLTLLSFVMACFLVIFEPYDKAVYSVAFFTSFAGIFVYQNRHIFFVLIALYIIRSLFQKKVNKTTFVYFIFIFAYCLFFSNFDGTYTFVHLIGLILLFAISVIAFNSDKFDARELMRHYILGFVIETIVGFYINSIPAMYDLFAVDLMWTETFQEVTRFFGLSFDSNFYALSNYVIIAYLLFTFKSITPFRGCLILFLIISGVQTISKSYYLLVGALLIIFMFKNISNIKRLMLYLLVGVLGIWLFMFISNQLGYNAISMIGDRFVEGGSFAENTTGRTDIWQVYMESFREAGFKELFFGFGYNAPVEVAAHNTFIEFLYFYGIFGVAMWLSYFIHCGLLFRANMKTDIKCSVIVLITMLIGIFFLSAYTYESFWFGIVVSLLSLGKGERSEKTQYV